MEKDKIFFGESGLTTTSANHIANLAKEIVNTLETSLEGIRFYDTRAGLLSNSNDNLISKGIDDLSNVETTLENIAKYKSLIAWLREAIKAKDRLIKEARLLENSEIAKTLGIELPDEPIRDEVLTEDSFVATWTIKKRNHFYYLGTLCAVIGGFIHPDGKFSKERAKLKDIINNPTVLRGEGRDAILWQYIPSMYQEDVDETFFALQTKYRAYQAELNTMRHEIELAIQGSQRNSDAKYNEERADYTNKMHDILSKIEAYRRDLIGKMQALKIVIPDSLKEVYREVNK